MLNMNVPLILRCFRWKMVSRVEICFSVLICIVSGLGGNSSSTEKLTPVLHDDAITKLNVTTPEDSFEPFFNSSVNTEIYAPVGGKAKIECRVGNLGEHAVSWIRGEDMHILAIGSITYTADTRFTSIHSQDDSRWMLTIFPVKPKDAGSYECQISTEPKKSKVFTLHTTDTVSTIMGGREVFVREGSSINLTCNTQGSVRPADHINWWRNEVLLNTAYRGGIAINTDKVRGWSNLLIYGSSSKDSGNYTCDPSNSLPVLVQVHVLSKGDLAAFQTVAGLTGGSAAGPAVPVSCGHQVLVIITCHMILLSLHFGQLFNLVQSDG